METVSLLRVAPVTANNEGQGIRIPLPNQGGTACNYAPAVSLLEHAGLFLAVGLEDFIWKRKNL